MRYISTSLLVLLYMRQKHNDLRSTECFYAAISAHIQHISEKYTNISRKQVVTSETTHHLLLLDILLRAARQTFYRRAKNRCERGAIININIIIIISWRGRGEEQARCARERENMLRTAREHARIRVIENITARYISISST